MFELPEGSTKPLCKRLIDGDDPLIGGALAARAVCFVVDLLF